MNPDYPLYYLNFVQVVVFLNTIVLFFSIRAVKRGKISTHKLLSNIAVISTLVGVIGLEATRLMGWDYKQLTSPERLHIHLCFSVGLLPILLAVAYTGWTHKRAIHKKLVMVMIPFWLGTLVTGVWFFPPAFLR